MSCQSAPGCENTFCSLLPISAHQCRLSVPISAASSTH
ncbi:unnamed protein product, partial [Staurois parvus]